MQSGIINVYKEAGFTSFDVVAKLRGMLHIRKIGHTGTLDPDATGVLPVCIGKATKVCDLLTDKDKEYEAVLLLGQRTDTLDISGTVLEEAEVFVTEDQVRSAMESFVGDIMQVPPMYSALKVNGKKLYEYARAGQDVERKSRPVTIYSIDILEISLPRVRFLVHCSKGTYIRSLCDDIGRYLGCFGCMESLVRTRVDVFDIHHAYHLSEIQEAIDSNRLEELVTPIDALFQSYDKYLASACEEKLIVNGGRIRVSHDAYCQDAGVLVYLSDGRFVGVYKMDGDSLRLEKMFLE